MSTTYHIHDEPASRKTSALIVNPFWALLGVMLAGAWLGAIMLSINAWLLRGPTWRREIGLAISILVGSAAIFFGLVIAEQAGLLPERFVRYALLLVVAWKLGLAYWIFVLQQNTFALYEYFSAHAQPNQPVPLGAIMVMAGTFFRSAVIGVSASPAWIIAVS